MRLVCIKANETVTDPRGARTYPPKPDPPKPESWVTDPEPWLEKSEPKPKRIKGTKGSSGGNNNPGPRELNDPDAVLHSPLVDSSFAGPVGGWNCGGDEDDKSFFEKIGKYLYDDAMAEQQMLEFGQEVTPIAIKHLNADVGVGTGLGASVTIGPLEIDAIVSKIDAIHLKLEEGKFEVGGVNKSSFGVTVLEVFPGGYENTKFHPIKGDCGHSLLFTSMYDLYNCNCTEIESGFTSNIEIGVEVYFGIGIEAKIGFDVVGFFTELDKIYGD